MAGHPGPRRALGGLLLEAGQLQQVAQHAQHLPARTGLAQRRTPWKLCTRPSALTKVPAVSVNGAIGSNTSASSTAAISKGGQATTISAAIRGLQPSRRPSAPRPAGSTFHSSSLQAAIQHLAGVHRLQRLRRRPVGRRPCWRPPVRVADAGAGVLADPVGQGQQAGGVRMLRGGICRTGWPCRARRAAALAMQPALRRWPVPAAGALTPLVSATAAATSQGTPLRPQLQLRPAAASRRAADADGDAPAPCFWPPGADALGEQQVILAQKEPTTSAAFGLLAAMAAQPARAPRRVVKSAWRRRWSMLSLPRARTSLPAGAALRWCCAQKPARRWPLRRARRPTSGRWHHVLQRQCVQSTSFHWPPCLIMGLGGLGCCQGLVGEAVAVGDPALVDLFVLQRNRASPRWPLDLDDQVGTDHRAG